MFYPYKNVFFKSGVEISLHYVWASKVRPVVPEAPVFTERREDHSLCPILCSEPLCLDIFDATEDPDKHILENNHSFSIVNTSMDNVKSKFITKIKLSAVDNLLLSTNCRISPIQSYSPLFDIFNKGWALHTRSKSCINDKQKALLWQYFIDSEKSRKKKT